MWRYDDPQSNESSKCKYDIVPYTRGRGLDIGCGPYKAFPHFIGVDNGHHWGTEGADVVSDAQDLSMFASQSMDFVFSSHNLEHIEDHKAALKEWWRVIKPGGHLVLYLPHKDLYPNIGEKGSNPDHKHDFHPDDIVEVMSEYKWDLVVNEKRDNDNGPGQYGNEYSFLQVYRKQNKIEYSYKNERPKKTACVVRYGGIGDMIQASSIFPTLKDQGYHVTVMTTPSGQNILKEDPYIDDFVIQDRDQVPNNELVYYWKTWEKKFTKFINLSESVEGTLLALPGRTNHGWSADARRKLLNKNYLEMTHTLADLPFKPSPKFYPTIEEKAWARKQRNKIGGQIILWSLAGSSVHKSWPWLDQTIARILITYPDAKIVLTGDAICQILEQGWENEPRVICKSGQWGIRNVLAFAQIADLVIGSETGILNAVGHEDVNKIVCLSHSSHENLTKHWRNTIVLEPNVDCYPCHMMHYSFEFCHRDEETGTAQCQANISPDLMFMSIRDSLRQAA